MARTVRRSDLRSATEASIKAILGKQLVRRPGILAGFWIDKASLSKLEVTPTQLARQVAGTAAKLSGIRLTPAVRPGNGGSLVGFIPPRIFKR
jgi:hypothetical protein